MSEFGWRDWEIDELWSCNNGGARDSGRAPLLEVGGGVFIPLPNLAVASLQGAGISGLSGGRNIRPPPEYPAQILKCPAPNIRFWQTNAHLVVLWSLAENPWGPEYPAENMNNPAQMSGLARHSHKRLAADSWQKFPGGRNIRPIIQMSGLKYPFLPEQHTSFFSHIFLEFDAYKIFLKSCIT